MDEKPLDSDRTPRPDFFDRKRPWSRVKDRVLFSYMKPYLAKVRVLRQPIFVVDAFAGPGTFREGPGNRPEDGSPMIIGAALREYPPEDVQGFSFNHRKKHHEELQQAFKDRGLARHCRCGQGDARNLLRRFADYVEETAPQATVFVFLDPFGASGVEFEVIQRLLSRPGASTEFLINIRASALHRMAAVRLNAQANSSADLDWGNLDPLVDRPPGWEDPGHDRGWLIEVEDDDDDALLQRTYDEAFASDDVHPTERWHPTLDAIFGDRMRWLPHLLNFSAEPGERVRRAMAEFRAGLREHTTFAGSCEVKSRADGPAKHYITFCSRSDDALVLMNDAMIAATEQSAHATWIRDHGGAALFTDWRDLRATPREAISAVARRFTNRHPEGVTRKHLVSLIIGAEFVRYTKSEILDTIREMVQNEELDAINSKAKARFNDETVLRPRQQALF